MLASTYVTPNDIFPFSNKLTVSNENVENVVKPPQTPTVKNSNKFELIGTILDENSVIIPIITAPTKLINNVANGKVKVNDENAVPTRYLQTAPTNPPNPTNKHFNIESSFKSISKTKVFYYIK